MVEIRDLRLGSPTPNFRLHDVSGNEVELRNYRHRKPVVIFFMHDPHCDQCRNLLKQFKSTYQEYQIEKVEVLIVVGVAEGEAKELSQSMNLPFPVLADPKRIVFENYIGEFQTGLYVLDRYNAQQIKMVAEDADQLMTPDEALSWAAFSETTCPECGVLEWRSE
jgi:peroxiredoxin